MKNLTTNQVEILDTIKKMINIDLYSVIDIERSKKSFIVFYTKSINSCNLRILESYGVERRLYKLAENGIKCKALMI